MFSVESDKKHHLLKRFPKIELSYETIPHTKVLQEYNICVGIPIGVKAYAWITFYGKDDVCFMMELNKEKNITKITGFPLTPSCSIFANGTLLYGTIVSQTEFVIEDIYLYQGIPLKTMLFSERLGFLEKYIKTYSGSPRFYLPPMWPVHQTQPYMPLYDLPEKMGDKPFHHIQYRCLTKTAPYLNVFPNKKGFINVTPSVINRYIPWGLANYTKPQYKQLTVFKVMADISFDIYRLFVYGQNKSEIYYNVAYIPNYKTSVMMNRIFRKIKENENLDAIEESDDEEDFENIHPEKYVDLKKWVLMEFRFHTKFKKWVPLRIVDSRVKVVHIGQL